MMILPTISLFLALSTAPLQSIAIVKELYHEGRFAEARAKLNEITPSQTNSVDLLLYKGLLETDAGKAITYLKKLISDYPETEYQHEARFAIAQHQFLQESYKDATSSLRPIIEAGKESGYHSLSCLWMARCYEARYDTMNAIAWYERIDAQSDSISYSIAIDALKTLKRAKSIYSIQIGSFQSKESAHELAALYAEKGYETWLATTHKEGVKYYKVLIGEFDSREMAEGFLELFTEKESVTHWIVKVRRL
jgi:tetratricopeptide (TPR) repeat protein